MCRVSEYLKIQKLPTKSGQERKKNCSTRQKSDIDD